jgi:hypothetical protein
VSQEASDGNIQIGFPVLPGGKDSLRFALLQAWLEWCDNGHGCKRHDNKLKIPTRLLCVADQDKLRLVSGRHVGAAKYVALSHCWGKLKPNEVPPYCTTIGNISDREKGFSITNLPLTFRDAIEVAQGLDIQYLWIDSLCIIQGDGGDWEHEAKRMEDVYTSAYCTIAATSAADSNTGFLERKVISEYVSIQDDSGRHVYVCTDVADFDEDIESAELNQRGWVMQERLLSCRTIHFGTKQVYWECGEGVYCEDLTRLTR